MNWHTLYSPRRGKNTYETGSAVPGRSDYQRDYDRLIFSSPFRRLQNKTQVFPLPGSIFVHNRLTHSLEVASVGRSLGALAGNRIYELHKQDAGLPADFETFYRYDLANVVAAACIAHDIGNPPFGHSGEKALAKFFIDNEKEKAVPGSAKVLREYFSDAEWQDLVLFEGNANAFRLLTRQFNGRLDGGYRLTYTTLAGILKYPCESLGVQKGGRISRKKFGFFQGEKDTFLEIAGELGMPQVSDAPLCYARHPFVYLTEAADDICYSIIDLEDAHRQKIASYEEVSHFMIAFFKEDKERLDKIQDTLGRLDDTNERVSYLRAITIGRLTDECQEAFVRNREALLTGEYNRSLTGDISSASMAALKEIETFSLEKIYNHRSVIEIELAGYEVLGGLLEAFVPALLEEKKSHASQKLIKLIPEQFYKEGQQLSPYDKVMAALDYVSGMTDVYAVELYRRIRGISLPY